MWGYLQLSLSQSSQARAAQLHQLKAYLHPWCCHELQGAQQVALCGGSCRACPGLRQSEAVSAQLQQATVAQASWCYSVCAGTISTASGSRVPPSWCAGEVAMHMVSKLSVVVWGHTFCRLGACGQLHVPAPYVLPRRMEKLRESVKLECWSGHCVHVSVPLLICTCAGLTTRP